MVESELLIVFLLIGLIFPLFFYGTFVTCPIIKEIYPAEEMFSKTVFAFASCKKPSQDFDKAKGSVGGNMEGWRKLCMDSKIMAIKLKESRSHDIVSHTLRFIYPQNRTY